MFASVKVGQGGKVWLKVLILGLVLVLRLRGGSMICLMNSKGYQNN